MTGMTNIAGKAAVVRGVLGALFLVLCVSATGEGRDWYVKAKAKSGGDGDKNKPFDSCSRRKRRHSPATRSHSPVSLRRCAGRRDPVEERAEADRPRARRQSGKREQRPGEADATRPTPASTATSWAGEGQRGREHPLRQRVPLVGVWHQSGRGEDCDNLMTNDMAVHDIYDIEGPAPRICAMMQGSPGLHRASGRTATSSTRRRPITSVRLRWCRAARTHASRRSTTC